MPCLVDEVGVAGDGVDLAALRLELVIVLCEVLELGRADEGEVRGIEEEQALRAERVLLRDGLEVTVLVGLDAELPDFLSDE